MKDPRLRGERPENPMAYQTPTHAELYAEIRRLDAERQAVLDCINLYGDETLHKALDSIGWPNGTS